MTPKGTLIIIGGHEDKGVDGESLNIEKRREPTARPHLEILSALISNIPRAHHIIEIIATASAIPQEMEDIYRAAYKIAGFTKVDFMRIEHEEQGNDAMFVKRIEYSHAVFFTGGDQTRLTTTLANTKVLEATKKKYLADPNFIVAGTSAGAMAVPQHIITGGVIKEAIMKDDVRTGEGFDFIEGVIVDTHFVKRGRFGRLAHAVALNTGLLGIGLGEDTALIITNGNEALCEGSGMVIIIDGTDIGKNNANEVDATTPVVIENMKVHILAEGSKFLLKERKFV